MNTRGEMARTFIRGGRWQFVSFALWYPSPDESAPGTYGYADELN